MKRMWRAAIFVGLSGPAFAQEPRTVPPQEFAERAALEKRVAAGKESQEQRFQPWKVAVEARITTSAPYSAEAVTETAQTLADGNRIDHKSTTRVYRDSEGRTRREELSDGAVLTISIVDPVEHVSYMLLPKSHNAYRGDLVVGTPVLFQGVPGAYVADKQAAEVAARATLPPPPPPPPPSQIPPPPPPPPAPGMKVLNGGEGEVVKEDLGRQNIEGVPATGSRTTWTIAPGAIGNLQPIKIVLEQWFSPDLQLLVLTKHNDPRTGETTYRLQNIVRAEPDRSLFTVPADYRLNPVIRPAIRKE